MDKGAQNPLALFRRIQIRILVIGIEAIDKINDLVLFGIICYPKHGIGQLGVGFVKGIVWLLQGLVYFRPGVDISG